MGPRHVRHAPATRSKHGFDLFYGYNCQRHAHTHYPTYLYRNDERFDLPGNDGEDAATASRHDLFEKEALAFLDANKEKPFFLYLPFTVPHVAVQVPEDSLAEYQGKLGDDPPYDGKKGYLPHPAPHAGVRRDGHAHGPHRRPDPRQAEGTEARREHAGALHQRQRRRRTTSAGRDSHVLRIAPATLRGLKGSLYEGGIRVPMVACWPGKIKPGTTSDHRLRLLGRAADAVRMLCTGAEGLGRDRQLSVARRCTARSRSQHDFLYWEFPGYGGQQAVRRRLEGGAAEAGEAAKSKPSCTTWKPTRRDDRRGREAPRRGEEAASDQ